MQNSFGKCSLQLFVEINEHVLLAQNFSSHLLYLLCYMPLPVPVPVSVLVHVLLFEYLNG